MSAEAALLASTAAHFGFQATVTVMVYPALARVPAAQWRAAHDAHSRAITGLVVIVYGALVVTGGWALWSGPNAWTLVALAATAVALTVTAVAAAPAHARLGGGHDPERIAALLRIDRIRAVASTIAVAAAAVALS
ncbi:hypothetical protein [Dactylosporangium matsuzakiense]|uniref:DUF1772 domain-containing protein n=1 Tax=Dactylosporangium matsuzakiense TaxID=53360 RepID=A0A9W6KWZ1_9ACTN|nr:hypothetical protein [Dactylosporangium matsuzakiense]UWZ41415.1 hypothetical protein Dmats_27520 [Dactylosporangium matsuzakiense]GLL06969.1 hypothetical protein GCM10017581_087200 [Dactylosporangium matsuzakiense]